MRKVLVLGGGGFIGRNIVEALLVDPNYHVTAADIKAGSNWKKFEESSEISDRFIPIIADFSKLKSFKLLAASYDDVYFLAAIVGVNRTLKHPEEVIRVNTNLTMNVLAWLETAEVKNLMFASSSENYAGTSDLFDTAIPTAEDVPLCISDVRHPRWTYAMTKMHGEAALLHSANALNYSCKIVRYQNIIGPEMGFGHAIPHIVQRFVEHENGQDYAIYGADQTRAFCYISDAVAGTIKVTESPNSLGQIYHIGNDIETTIEVVTKYIGGLLNYNGSYKNSETYPGSVARRCPDISKAKSDVNYQPKISWEEALKRTTDWYEKYFKSGNLPTTGGFEPPSAVAPKVH